MVPFANKQQIINFIKQKTLNINLLNYEISQIIDSILSTGVHPSDVSETNVLNAILNALNKKPFFIRNSQNIPRGIFMTMEGNADEMIVVGKLIKMGFNCSRVDVTNSKYDAVVDTNGKLLRVQIKGTSTNTLSLTCNWRSGQQIARGTSRARKINSGDCDILIGVSNHNARCYVIPVKDLTKFGTSVALSNLASYEEKWDNIQ
jgi:hypothetical protein